VGSWNFGMDNGDRAESWQCLEYVLALRVVISITHEFHTAFDAYVEHYCLSCLS